ncbi:Rieske (2Fe-2S) protein [Maribacter algicola]|uniref:Rieske (2Fe-2S) protein n=1 Tax=Maribacter algicola TaxID=2498892 RepID=A0A3R8R3D9_9FLAO|nr:Rieske 2Fe-2S domain-containing protein [Maribacter algicola]RRQ49141.1 Rieske (2Fe-2S) protein [Maribacter algicola]
MQRKEFLKSLGAGAAFAITFPCLGSCSKDNGENGNIVEEPTNVDFTVDLSSAEASNLATNGGFILKNLVVIARNLEGELVAASQVCSHEGYDEVRFVNQNGGIFYCDVHGSQFAQNGNNLNPGSGRATRPLKVYQTSLDGDILRVFE